MFFSQVAGAFAAIEQAQGRLDKTTILAQLLSQASPDDASRIALLSLGAIHPPYRGTQFNIAEKVIAGFIGRLIAAEESIVLEEIKSVGDAGLFLEQQLCSQKDLGVCSSITLEHLFTELASLEAVEGAGARDEREERFCSLVKRLDPRSAKYVVRIVLGTLRLGFSDMTLLDAFSWMVSGTKEHRAEIERAYNVCVDIGMLIKILKQDGMCGLERLRVTPGVPVRPAAAERLASPEAIFEKIGPCYSQPKLDGFRLQVHKMGDEVLFFSRNLQGKTDVFPELTVAVRSLKVGQMIAEGEAIAYNPDTGEFLPFQQTAKRGRKHYSQDAALQYPLRMYLFDLLYADGISFLDAPHEDRREALLTYAVGSDDVMPIGEELCSSAHEVTNSFERAISSGLEGIVVKKRGTVYTPGKRNFNWIKLKRKETGGLEDTIDAVVLGYYRGQGRRALFGIGALLLGVYSPEDDQFYTVAKCGSGQTDEEWREHRDELDKLELPSCPNGVNVARELQPDVWVEPSLVVVVRADEITKSPLHSAGKSESESGFALRFPRFIQVRSDKGAREATTVGELAQLYALQFSERNKR